MEDYVKQIEERSVQVVAKMPGNIASVESLGGTYSGTADTWQIDYGSEDHLASVLQALRDAGFAFGGGNAGWPPAAVAKMLRDKSKFHGSIREALWLNPNHQIIQET